MIALSASIVLSAATMADTPNTYVETFDDGLNHSGWTWDRAPLGTVESSGGNPGGFFKSELMAVPNLFSTHAIFTGDFRGRGVSSIGGDLTTVEFSAGAGEISIALAHHNGTPDNFFDDTWATFVTSIAAPVNPTFGWVSFDVPIPSGASSTPADWRLSGVLPFIPPTVDWNTLITHVDEVLISWSDPGEPTLLFDVVRGADNLRITSTVPAPATAVILVGSLACLGRRRRS